MAVALKFTFAILTNPAVIGLLRRALPYPIYVASGGLYVGVESSVFEMGFTILAGLIWRQLGKDSTRAIAIGVGAGAFEAFLLGLLSAVGMVAVIMSARGNRSHRQADQCAADRHAAILVGGAGRASDRRAGSCLDPGFDLARPHLP